MEPQFNIRIDYMYRDAGNYKEFGSKVFTNKNYYLLRFVRMVVEKALIDDAYFCPAEWGFPRLSFGNFDPEADHPWHEIQDIVYTDEEGEADIEDLLTKLVGRLSENKNPPY